MQKIEAAEWDEKWDETLASPESIMDFERICAKMDQDHATGNDKEYLTDTDADLEKLFQSLVLGSIAQSFQHLSAKKQNEFSNNSEKPETVQSCHGGWITSLSKIILISVVFA